MRIIIIILTTILVLLCGVRDALSSYEFPADSGTPPTNAFDDFSDSEAMPDESGSAEVEHEDIAVPEEAPSEMVPENAIVPEFTTIVGESGSPIIIPLPENWMNDVCIEQINDEFSFALSFYDIRSLEMGYGGHLVTLYVDCIGTDYSYLPHYEILGTFANEDGIPWTVVAAFPTDVQFDPEHEESRDYYMFLTEQMYAMIYSIYPNEGYAIY